LFELDNLFKIIYPDDKKRFEKLFEAINFY